MGSDFGLGLDEDKGQRVELDPEALEGTELRLLASALKFKTNYFIIPREQPMELLDLRIIFSLLRKRAEMPEPEQEEEEQLPFEAFQRAFERMFYVMQDPIKFDAKEYDENGDGFVAWGEFFRVYKRRNITVHLSFCERLYLTFDNPESSFMAQIVSVLILATIIVSSFCFILSTTPECQIDAESCTLLEIIEKCCLVIFVIEFCVRICTVWAVRTEVHDKAKLQELVVGFEPISLPSPLQRLGRFIRTPANIIDLAAILPGVVGIFIKADGGAFVVLRLIRLTRIFRAFKSPALKAAVDVILRTLEKSTKALYVLAFNLCLGIVIFGSLMYMAEGGDDLKTFNVGGRWNETLQIYERKIGRQWTGQEWEWVWAETPFQSIPEAFWWAIVTATTVGYGDHSPTTTMGYMVATATMVFSMVILALPVGVMGGTFSQEWDSFQREKAEKAANQAQEMAFITRAITKLDPTKMARLMLLEVWHDHPSMPCKDDARPPPANFLGEAKLELELPADEALSRELTLRLQENNDMVKRSVTGHLVIRYDWTPGGAPPGGGKAGARGGASPKSPRSPRLMLSKATSFFGEDEMQLNGKLTVTVVEASNLLNLNCAGGVSNPYATILAYPTCSATDGPQPFFWRMPSIRNKLNPQFHMSHTFKYNWSTRAEMSGGGTGECEPQETPHRRQSTNTHVGEWRSEGNRSLGGLGPQLDEALGMLRELATELRQQRVDMRQVKDEVRALSGCVEKMSARTVPEGTWS